MGEKEKQEMSPQPGIRALIVEDDYVVARLIARLLGEIGYTVVGNARDGLEAVEQVQATRPDVVLMDIQMPDMDGLEATRQIYERCPTPVVVLTAHDAPELVRQASEVGVGAYLVKPPSARAMERAITIAVARFDDLMALRRLNARLEARNEELEEALAQIKTLRGLLPICANCKRIRDDKGHWHPIEAYIRDRSEADFTHGFCPECMKKLYPDFARDDA